MKDNRKNISLNLYKIYIKLKISDSSKKIPLNEV